MTELVGVISDTATEKSAVALDVNVASMSDPDDLPGRQANMNTTSLEEDNIKRT